MKKAIEIAVYFILGWYSAKGFRLSMEHSRLQRELLENTIKFQKLLIEHTDSVFKENKQ